MQLHKMDTSSIQVFQNMLTNIIMKHTNVVDTEILNTIDSAEASGPLDLSVRHLQTESPITTIKSQVECSPVSGGWVMLGHTLVPYVWRGHQYLSESVIKYAAGLLRNKCNRSTGLQRARDVNVSGLYVDGIDRIRDLILTENNKNAKLPAYSTAQESMYFNQLCTLAGIIFTFKENTCLISLKFIDSHLPRSSVHHSCFVKYIYIQ